MSFKILWPSLLPIGGLILAVAATVAVANGWTLSLGLDGKGTVLLVIFATYLFTTIVP